MPCSFTVITRASRLLKGKGNRINNRHPRQFQGKGEDEKQRRKEGKKIPTSFHSPANSKRHHKISPLYTPSVPSFPSFHAPRVDPYRWHKWHRGGTAPRSIPGSVLSFFSADLPLRSAGSPKEMEDQTTSPG